MAPKQLGPSEASAGILCQTRWDCWRIPAASNQWGELGEGFGVGCRRSRLIGSEERVSELGVEDLVSWDPKNVFGSWVLWNSRGGRGFQLLWVGMGRTTGAMEASVTWVTILGFAVLLQQASAEGEHSSFKRLQSGFS